MSKRKLTFEESLENLEIIIEKLESGEETLAETIKLYEDGMETAEKCREILEKAKQKLIICEGKK